MDSRSLVKEGLSIDLKFVIGKLSVLNIWPGNDYICTDKAVIVPHACPLILSPRVLQILCPLYGLY